MRWSSVGFLHWGYDPDVVARLLPSSLRADLYGGQAWVGYQFLTISPTADSMLSRLPGWAARRTVFNEMRLRVCVVDGNDLPGIHLLSVDNDRSSVVRWQRRTLNLSSFHAKVSGDTDRLGGLKAPGSVVDYRSERRDGTTARARIRITGSRAETDVDRFLTARWRVMLPPRFWVDGTENRWVVNAHDRWLLQRASALTIDDDALIAAGLPSPTGAPVALWSPGTIVETSTPRAAMLVS